MALLLKGAEAVAYLWAELAADRAPGSRPPDERHAEHRGRCAGHRTAAPGRSDAVAGGHCGGHATRAAAGTPGVSPVSWAGSCWPAAPWTG